MVWQTIGLEIPVGLRAILCYKDPKGPKKTNLAQALETKICNARKYQVWKKNILARKCQSPEPCCSAERGAGLK